MFSALDGIYKLRDHKTKRVSSYDRTGGNDDSTFIKAGETKVVADIKGAGVIRHIWITMGTYDGMIRRNAIIRMYWDGEDKPSVEAPIGDFFGQGWGENYNYASMPLAAAPSGGHGLNCYFPMPFGNGARIEIENESDKDIIRFYFNIDYELHDTVTAEDGRFHAWWNRELTQPGGDGNETQDGRLNKSDANNYLCLYAEGKGHVVGINYFVDSPTPIWYGEGDDMWMVDGEPWPGSMHGTGTEDLFNTAWSPNELYSHPYFGFARIPAKLGWMGRTHCYRFFLEDPVFFEKSLRFSIEHGHGDALTLDIATVTYWYQTEPHKAFPLFPAKAARQNLPDIGPNEVHRWRDSWRREKDRGKGWGNE